MLGLNKPVPAAKQETPVAPVEETPQQPKEEKPEKPVKPAIKESKPAMPVTKAPVPEERKDTTPSSRRVFVFIPIGIPGMGKSHFSSAYLEKSLKSADGSAQYTTISYDVIRKQCLDKWMQKNPQKIVEDGLKATAKEATSKWFESLQSELTRSTKQGTSAIFLDKNYPPAEFAQTLSTINSHQLEGVQITKIAVVPTIAQPLDSYPFSADFFLQCYLRCLGRSGHLTISNDDPERIVKILVLFFKQFKDVAFN